MRRLASLRLWMMVGALVLAAGMPYCSAALGWAAVQDDDHIYIREDVVTGLIVAWTGFAILAACGGIWLARTVGGHLRPGRRATAASVRARAPSRA